MNKDELTVELVALRVMSLGEFFRNGNPEIAQDEIRKLLSQIKSEATDRENITAVFWEGKKTYSEYVEDVFKQYGV